MTYTLHLGDCIETLRAMPDNSIDSVVTDPPYGIRFMGKSWDGADIEARASYRASMPSHAAACGPNGGHRSVAAEAGKYDLTPAGMIAFQAFTFEWACECLRVLKPGGHLLSFAAARTYHHMAVGIEMAGFEIRDQIMWVFGSGFPKSHNLKGEHEGWGTALKPAHEPICMARKPLAGTVAANVLAHGTGALNIEGCRVEPTGESRQRAGEVSQQRRYTDAGGTNFAAKPGIRGGDPSGRWPANLIHDGSAEVVAMFPAEAGAAAPVRARGGDKFRSTYGAFAGSIDEAGSTFHNDDGSAARFFYCAKTSRKDRNEGLLTGDQKAVCTNATMRQVEDADWPARNGNHHPTVKPTDLMAYLCRLVTPAGGLVLDPFMGSGSTGKAAMREGFHFIGCELDPEYLAITKARIEHEQAKVAAARERAAATESQLSLFGS
ncbi:DNA-methyltransferase [Pseudomonas monteilii]